MHSHADADANIRCLYPIWAFVHFPPFFPFIHSLIINIFARHKLRLPFVSPFCFFIPGGISHWKAWENADHNIFIYNSVLHWISSHMDFLPFCLAIFQSIFFRSLRFVGPTNVPVNFPLSKNFPILSSIRPLNAQIIFKFTSESISDALRPFSHPSCHFPKPPSHFYSTKIKRVISPPNDSIGFTNIQYNILYFPFTIFT